MGSHYQLATYEPLFVTLEGVDHVLGAVEHILLSAGIEDGGARKPDKTTTSGPDPHVATCSGTPSSAVTLLDSTTTF